MEIGILRRILKQAKRWHLVADKIPHLPERKDIGRALSHKEKVKLTRMAAERPEWANACLAMTLALNTTMRGCERDVDLIERVLTVRRRTTETDAGTRKIPINADAWAAVQELWQRAKPFDGTNPDHYVFPACENRRIDPTQPMNS
jgi:integrase